jgi:hypothetical protein
VERPSFVHRVHLNIGKVKVWVLYFGKFNQGIKDLILGLVKKDEPGKAISILE